MKPKIDKVTHMIVHHIGNKSNGEGVGFSREELNFKAIEPELLKLIERSFNHDDLYHFYYEGTVDLNPVYSFSRAIFNNPQEIVNQSNHIAKILYDCSEHPKIKAGELSVIYLTGYELDGEEVDALALIKSETRQSVLQLDRTNEGFVVSMNDAINLSKVEKGCLIFNVDESEGYRIAIVDNSSSSGDAKYWKDSFLHVSSYNGAHHQTSNLINLAAEFISDTVAGDSNIPSVEKAMIANRSKQVLAEMEEETITFDEYAHAVFKDSKLEEKFSQYAEENATAELIESDTIYVEPKAINKRRSKISTIHLDDNFDLLIKGGEERILRGYDEDAGMNFYKLFFEKEK
ncbi:MAG: nucleoid-associated protein [Bacteroidales bacterium]|nr:nucleoid-associated protein [Bacteroidales bacterium]